MVGYQGLRTQKWRGPRLYWGWFGGGRSHARAGQQRYHAQTQDEGDRECHRIPVHRGLPSQNLISIGRLSLS